jgi:four helix bundle protein
MIKNIIREKSADFAVRIVELTRYLKRKRAESILINQILRSGTSVSANVHEATVSFTKKEFAAKISIALKEARETNFWLSLLFRTNTLSEKEFDLISKDCTEIEKILFSILKTIRERSDNE